MPVANIAGMVETLEIRNIGELASYRLLWNSWIPQTPRATFFNTWDWLDTYWRHFGEEQELRALLVRSAGTPIGILPLCVRTERRRIGTVRVLTHPLDNWGTWYGAVGSNRATTMLAAMQHLRHAKRDWDLLELPNTVHSARDSSRTSRSMCVVGLLSNQRPHAKTSLVNFKGDWNSFLADKPRKLRHEVRRVLRRTLERSDIEYIRHRPAATRDGDGDPRWDLYAMCEHVALASWQANSTNGNTLTHDRVRHFLRDAHEAAAHNGMVDVNLLVADGRPAAFVYGYHYNGNVNAMRIGYDPAVGLPGAGTALLLKTLEDGRDRGDECYDLGPGEARFQRQLRTHVDTTFKLTHWPAASLRSQAVRLAHWARGQWNSPKRKTRKAS